MTLHLFIILQFQIIFQFRMSKEQVLRWETLRWKKNASAFVISFLFLLYSCLMHFTIGIKGCLSSHFILASNMSSLCVNALSKNKDKKEKKLFLFLALKSILVHLHKNLAKLDFWRRWAWFLCRSHNKEWWCNLQHEPYSIFLQIICFYVKLDCINYLWNIY